jgi:pimeloyl-ACP methyl ester carboxylesterase
MADVQPLELPAGDVALSGLLAEPSDPPRATVLALHGGGMHAGYFHGRAHPDLSLLTLGAELGYTVLSLDRPGYGASDDGQGFSLERQTDLVWAALDHFADKHDTGAGVFLVGHSYGMKLCVFLAGSARGGELIGLDVSGAGLRYHPDRAAIVHEGATDPAMSPREAFELFWGPAHLYPPEAFSGRNRPMADVPPAEQTEARDWPELLQVQAPRVTVPVRFTIADHEKWWDNSAEALAEFRSLFSSAPRLEIRWQPSAGHNISLGWAARGYHLHALGFLEDCLASRNAAAAEVPEDD